MTRFAALLIGSALTSFVASYAFAADAAPTFAEATVGKPTSAEAKPAASSAAVSAPTVAAAAKDDAKAAAVKIGYVDMAKVAAESAEGKAASNSLKTKSEKLRAKIEARQKQIEKQKAAIEAKLPTMTQKERVAKGTEFQKKLEEYQKLVRSSELEINGLQDKLTNEVGGVIKKAAADYAKANGYVVIIEEKGVLYLDENAKPKDVTDEVVASMAKKQAK